MCDSWTQHRVSIHTEHATADLVSMLSEHGLALFDGVADQAGLLRLAQALAAIVPHRDSDHTGLTTIADLGGQFRSGFDGFTACALKPHTDRSGIAHPPALLMMACGQPATSGGECVVVDGKAVYDDLAESHPTAIKALSIPRSVLFGGATGHLGSIFTNSGNRITIRLRLDELAQFSPEVIHWLPILRAAIDRNANTFGLNVGQGYILDNHRWLHGRHAFTGQRVMHRINGNPLPNLVLIPGFQPARVLTPSSRHK